jgi:hypothetical protein
MAREFVLRSCHPGAGPPMVDLAETDPGRTWRRMARVGALILFQKSAGCVRILAGRSRSTRSPGGCGNRPCSWRWPRHRRPRGEVQSSMIRPDSSTIPRRSCPTSSGPAQGLDPQTSIVRSFPPRPPCDVLSGSHFLDVSHAKGQHGVNAVSVIRLATMGKGRRWQHPRRRRSRTFRSTIPAR